jgi:hypothetical protein
MFCGDHVPPKEFLPHQSPFPVSASRSPNVSAAGLPVLLAVLASHCVSSPRPAEQADKGPVTLLGLDSHALQWPSIAVRSDTAFVAGNVFFPGDSLIARPVYLGRVHQRSDGELVSLPPLQLPTGNFQFTYPRIALAGRTLHLVWAELEPRPRTVSEWRAITNRPTSLWHAAFEYDRWSSPERIATAYSFGWNSETGGVAVDASGTLHVAARKGDIDSVPHVHDFRLADGHWEESALPYTGLNESMAIATLGDTTIVALIDEPRDTARVMVVESTDHGAHWTNPIVASSRPRMQGAVSRLAFASTADGLLLAIGEKARSSFYLDTIRVVRLTGITRPWTTRFIEPPPDVDGLELAAAQCGSAVMLLRTLSGRPQVFELTLPTDSTASMIRPVLASATISAFPGLWAGRRSAIAVFGYIAAAGSPWRNAAMPLRVCST